MDVFYKKEFPSLLKAAILKEVRGYNPVSSPTPNCVNADNFNLNELFIEWDWTNGTPHNISALEKAINLALRHKHCSMKLIFKTISQALKWGVDFVLTRRSREARQFCNFVISVREELRNAKMNIKFIRTNNALIGHYLFSHNISDLLQSFYQKRFPNKRIIITPTEIPTQSISLKPPHQNPFSLSSPISLKSFF